jgi:hypothetical protein
VPNLLMQLRTERCCRPPCGRAPRVSYAHAARRYRSSLRATASNCSRFL